MAEDATPKQEWAFIAHTVAMIVTIPLWGPFYLIGRKIRDWRKG